MTVFSNMYNAFTLFFAVACKTQRGQISCFEIFKFLCSIVLVMWHNKLNFRIRFHCYLIKWYNFPFTHVVFLYGTTELFSDTRQNTAFTSVSSHVSGILAARAASVVWIHLSAVRTHCPWKPKSRLTRVECIFCRCSWRDQCRHLMCR